MYDWSLQKRFGTKVVPWILHWQKSHPNGGFGQVNTTNLCRHFTSFLCGITHCQFSKILLYGQDFTSAAQGRSQPCRYTGRWMKPWSRWEAMRSCSRGFQLISQFQLLASAFVVWRSTWRGQKCSRLLQCLEKVTFTSSAKIVKSWKPWKAVLWSTVKYCPAFDDLLSSGALLEGWSNELHMRQQDSYLQLLLNPPCPVRHSCCCTLSTFFLECFRSCWWGIFSVK